MSACCLCGAAPGDFWTGLVEGLPDPVSVCSEACEEQLWWIVAKGPSFGSAVAGPLSIVGGKRYKAR